MAKYMDSRLAHFAFLETLHLTINQGVDRVSRTGESRDNVIAAEMTFDLQDSERNSLGRKSYEVEFYRGSETKSIPEIIQLVADNIDESIIQAKIDFAGYDPNE